VSSGAVLVEFRGVGKRYGDVVALADLDLTILRGEVFGLLGPNGAGKTTAVLMLCGLLAPSDGTIRIAGHDVGEHALEVKRRIGFVPDGAPLYSNLSARQHLALVGRLHGLPEDEIRAETQRLLELLELAERIDDPVGEFSRGMRQKAALACALLPRPEMLVLDEPLSGLDAPTTATFKELFRAWADRGGAVLYTSHLLDVVERVCDRMAILSHGRLAGLGSLDELRRRSGREGTLEEVFAAIARTADPAERARALLGDRGPRLSPAAPDPGT
jgi:ABC-2 type transport system ATP-binding protein